MKITSTSFIPCRCAIEFFVRGVMIENAGRLEARAL
jgi:hypothetical protein